MQVVSGAYGHERVHFEAPDAGRLGSEMARFLAWFNAPASIDPVLKAGVAHFRFVTIHPFEDGNGRIARAIADLALARADGTKDRFYSMSSRIEAERKDYYRELESAQRGDVDITRWLAWFLGCLDRALDGADQTLAAVLFKARLWQRINLHPVNDRQRLVINRLLSRAEGEFPTPGSQPGPAYRERAQRASRTVATGSGPTGETGTTQDRLDGFQGFLSTSKYAKLAKCSTDTALRDILELLKRGILVQNPGRGRSTSYRLAGPEDIAD